MPSFLSVAPWMGCGHGEMSSPISSTPVKMNSKPSDMNEGPRPYSMKSPTTGTLPMMTARTPNTWRNAHASPSPNDVLFHTLALSFSRSPSASSLSGSSFSFSAYRPNKSATSATGLLPSSVLVCLSWTARVNEVSLSLSLSKLSHADGVLEALRAVLDLCRWLRSADGARYASAALTTASAVRAPTQSILRRLLIEIPATLR
mmetsp:Transcript_24916/g.61649  ORF Transcript_24916/g.61649 Transcript_24916/m.61649 type:complete len:203 (+) Transcript_24916:1074-1682(+)